MQQTCGTPRAKRSRRHVKTVFACRERTSAMLMFLSRSTTYLPSGCTFTSTLFFPITCIAGSRVSSTATQELVTSVTAARHIYALVLA